MIVCVPKGECWHRAIAAFGSGSYSQKLLLCFTLNENLFPFDGAQNETVAHWFFLSSIPLNFSSSFPFGNYISKHLFRTIETFFKWVLLVFYKKRTGKKAIRGCKFYETQFIYFVYVFRDGKKASDFSVKHREHLSLVKKGIHHRWNKTKIIYGIQSDDNRQQWWDMILRSQNIVRKDVFLVEMRAFWCWLNYVFLHGGNNLNTVKCWCITVSDLSMTHITVGGIQSAC